MPATAGGSTSGSSSNVVMITPQRDVVRDSTYATGVPTTRMAASAVRLVRRLTTSASTAAGECICVTRVWGETRRKIATTGSRTNVRSPAVASPASTARIRSDARSPFMASARRRGPERQGGKHGLGCRAHHERHEQPGVGLVRSRRD